jgi:hypothetical protein
METNDVNNTYAPPLGPPPPQVPEGGIAKYDKTYQRFYYVNLTTKRSQWEKPSGAFDDPATGLGLSSRIAKENLGSDNCLLASSAQTPPPQEPARACPGDRSHFAFGQKQDNCGFVKRLSSLFKHTPSQERTQSRRFAQSALARPQTQAGYARQPKNGGIGSSSAAAVGAGTGLLAGMILENLITSHGDRDRRYEQGFRDGADYAAGSILQGGYKDVGQDGNMGDASDGSPGDNGPEGDDMGDASDGGL